MISGKYLSRFIPKRAGEASQILLQNAHVLLKLRSYEEYCRRKWQTMLCCIHLKVANETSHIKMLSLSGYYINSTSMLSAQKDISNK
jgi:hypothetical protein